MTAAALSSRIGAVLELVLARAYRREHLDGRRAGEADRRGNLRQVGAQERIGLLLGADGRGDRRTPGVAQLDHLVRTRAQRSVLRLDGEREMDVRGGVFVAAID